MKESGRKNSKIKRVLIAPNSKLTRELLSQLAETRYFKTMTPEILQVVLKNGEYLEVPEGTILIEEGQQDTDMFFLLEGNLAAKSEGKVIIRFDSPGDVVGEFAVVSDQPRSADIVAETPSKLVRVSTAFLRRWSANPKLVVEFYTTFSHILTNKLRETSRRAELYEEAVVEVREIATTQSQLESEIEEKLSEIRRYSRVIESNQAAVLITDPEGIIINHNPAAKMLIKELGIHIDGKGGNILHLVKDFDLSTYPEKDFGEPWQGEWSRADSDNPLVYRVNVTPINGPERRLENVAFQMMDISLQKEQERDIEKKNEEIRNALMDLEATYQELQRSDLLKTETLNAISGELGAPIRKILNHAGKITSAIDQISPEELKTNLNAIQEQSEYLKIITENINYLIDLQSQLIRAGTVPVDIREVIGKVTGELKQWAKQLSITFDIDLPEDPLILSGDEEQFQTVLSLLVEQAVIVSRKKSKVGIRGHLMPGSDQVQLEISYAGPTFKNINPTEDNFKGRMGILIGMPLARKVISQYQGSLQFSGDNKAGVINVILPRVQKVGEERPNRIMIVDGLDMDRMITKGVIDHLWPESIILSTDNPFEFLDNYEDFAPDLVIIDPDIPEVGWGNHRVLASLTQNRRHMCPVLALSQLYKDFAERTIAVERGVTDFLEKPYSIFDLRFKVKSLLHSHRKEETLHHTMDQAQRQATTDALTRLANRKHFDDFMDTQIEYSRQTGKPVSLIMMDVDHFKHYNDTNGHQFGDEILKGMGRILEMAVRSSDLAARYGGEEFTVVLPETRKEMAMVVAEKIRRAILDGKFPNGEKQPMGFISASFGVATYGEDGKTGEQVIRAADECLYMAKNSGRNCVIAAGEQPPGAQSSAMDAS